MRYRHGKRATALFPGKEASAIRETVPAPPVRLNAQIKRLSITFTSSGKREFVPRDQVSPLLVAYCSFFPTHKLVFSRTFSSIKII